MQHLLNEQTDTENRYIESFLQDMMYETNQDILYEACQNRRKQFIAFSSRIMNSFFQLFTQLTSDTNNVLMVSPQVRKRLELAKQSAQKALKAKQAFLSLGSNAYLDNDLLGSVWAYFNLCIGTRNVRNQIQIAFATEERWSIIAQKHDNDNPVPCNLTNMFFLVHNINHFDYAESIAMVNQLNQICGKRSKQTPPFSSSPQHAWYFLATNLSNKERNSILDNITDNTEPNMWTLYNGDDELFLKLIKLAKEIQDDSRKKGLEDGQQFLGTMISFFNFQTYKDDIGLAPDISDSWRDKLKNLFQGKSEDDITKIKTDADNIETIMRSATLSYSNFYKYYIVMQYMAMKKQPNYKKVIAQLDEQTQKLVDQEQREAAIEQKRQQREAAIEQKRQQRADAIEQKRQQREAAIALQEQEKQKEEAKQLAEKEKEEINPIQTFIEYYNECTELLETRDWYQLENFIRTLKAKLVHSLQAAIQFLKTFKKTRIIDRRLRIGQIPDPVFINSWIEFTQFSTTSTAYDFPHFIRFLYTILLENVYFVQKKCITEKGLNTLNIFSLNPGDGEGTVTLFKNMLYRIFEDETQICDKEYTDDLGTNVNLAKDVLLQLPLRRPLSSDEIENIQHLGQNNDKQIAVQNMEYLRRVYNRHQQLFTLPTSDKGIVRTKQLNIIRTMLETNQTLQNLSILNPDTTLSDVSNPLYTSIAELAKPERDKAILKKLFGLFGQNNKQLKNIEEILTSLDEGYGLTYDRDWLLSFVNSKLGIANEEPAKKVNKALEKIEKHEEQVRNKQQETQKRERQKQIADAKKKFNETIAATGKTLSRPFVATGNFLRDQIDAEKQRQETRKKERADKQQKIAEQLQFEKDYPLQVIVQKCNEILDEIEKHQHVQLESFMEGFTKNLSISLEKTIAFLKRFKIHSIGKKPSQWKIDQWTNFVIDPLRSINRTSNYSAIATIVRRLLIQKTYLEQKKCLSEEGVNNLAQQAADIEYIQIEEQSKDIILALYELFNTTQQDCSLKEQSLVYEVNIVRNTLQIIPLRREMKEPEKRIVENIGKIADISQAQNNIRILYDLYQKIQYPWTIPSNKQSDVRSKQFNLLRYLIETNQTVEDIETVFKVGATMDQVQVSSQNLKRLNPDNDRNQLTTRDLVFTEYLQQIYTRSLIQSESERIKKRQLKRFRWILEYNILRNDKDFSFPYESTWLLKIMDPNFIKVKANRSFIFTEIFNSANTFWNNWEQYSKNKGRRIKQDIGRNANQILMDGVKYCTDCSLQKKLELYKQFATFIGDKNDSNTQKITTSLQDAIVKVANNPETDPAQIWNTVVKSIPTKSLFMTAISTGGVAQSISADAMTVMFKLLQKYGYNVQTLLNFYVKFSHTDDNLVAVNQYVYGARSNNDEINNRNQELFQQEIKNVRDKGETERADKMEKWSESNVFPTQFYYLNFVVVFSPKEPYNIVGFEYFTEPKSYQMYINDIFGYKTVPNVTTVFSELKNYFGLFTKDHNSLTALGGSNLFDNYALESPPPLSQTEIETKTTEGDSNATTNKDKTQKLIRKRFDMIKNGPKQIQFTNYVIQLKDHIRSQNWEKAFDLLNKKPMNGLLTKKNWNAFEKNWFIKVKTQSIDNLEQSFKSEQQFMQHTIRMFLTLDTFRMYNNQVEDALQKAPLHHIAPKPYRESFARQQKRANRLIKSWLTKLGHESAPRKDLFKQLQTSIFNEIQQTINNEKDATELQKDYWALRVLDPTLLSKERTEEMRWLYEHLPQFSQGPVLPNP